MVAALLVAAFAAACDAPSVNGPSFGYDPSISYSDATGVHTFLYHWPLGTTVRVYVDPLYRFYPYSGVPQGAGQELADAVQDGARLWQSQLFYREVSVRLVSSAADADVVVHFDETPDVVDVPPECALPFVQAAGVTLLCPTADYRGLEVLPLASSGGGHVKMDVTIVWSRIADQAQLRRVVAHEIGHVLGIGAHSGDRADLMFPVPQVDAPSGADGRTLRYVLHQAAAVVP